MSTATNSAYPQSFSSENAEVRLVSRSPWLWSDFKLVYVLVSCRVYWKVAKEDGSNKPHSFLDFRNADSLELIRQNEGTWSDVDDYVKVDKHNGRPRITVCGRLHRRTVHVEFIPNAPEQVEVWRNHIRARIAPWNLLQEEVKDISNRAPSSAAEELAQVLGRSVTSRVGRKPSSFPTDDIGAKWSDNLGTLPEQMKKLSIVDDLIAHGTAAVETGATLSKLVASVERVTETAEFVADASTCIAGVNTIFHLVALTAQGVSLYVEANRGRKMLPVAFGRIAILLRYVLESMTQIMKPSLCVNELDKDFVFKVLKQTVCTMDAAETQLLRGRASQIMNAEGDKQVERKIEELEMMAVIASNISRTCAGVKRAMIYRKNVKRRITGYSMCGRHYPHSFRDVRGSWRLLRKYLESGGVR